jgi:hypothetical protein
MRPPGSPNKNNPVAQEVLARLGVDGLEGQALLALKLQNIIVQLRDPALKLGYYQLLASVLRDVTRYQYSPVKPRTEETILSEVFLKALYGVVLKYISDESARDELEAVIEAYAARPRLALVEGSPGS